MLLGAPYVYGFSRWLQLVMLPDFGLVLKVVEEVVAPPDAHIRKNVVSGCGNPSANPLKAMLKRGLQPSARGGPICQQARRR